jgi:hypothetical protein
MLDSQLGQEMSRRNAFESHSFVFTNPDRKEIVLVLLKL